MASRALWSGSWHPTWKCQAEIAFVAADFGHAAVTSVHGGWLTWQVRQVEFVLQGAAPGVVGADRTYPRGEFGGPVSALGVTAQLLGQFGGRMVGGALGALDGAQGLLLKDGDGVGGVLPGPGTSHLQPMPAGASAVLGRLPGRVDVPLPHQHLDENGVAGRLGPGWPGAGCTSDRLGAQQLQGRLAALRPVTGCGGELVQPLVGAQAGARSEPLPGDVSGLPVAASPVVQVSRHVREPSVSITERRA